MRVNQRFLNRCLAGGFALLALGGLALAQDKRLIAREVISRIEARVGVPWQSETVDTFKAGNPDDTVTGIAVTMMATMDVLERAAASGKNLVITHEPTFYNHLDKLDVLPEKEKDPILAAKLVSHCVCGTARGVRARNYAQSATSRIGPQTGPRGRT